MRIIVTAGPTREYIDSVRFITNASSGRMGYALASTAADRGHDVTLLSGPVWLDPPERCRLVRFVTVRDLAETLGECFPECDALVMAAAVGDFRPANPERTKLRREARPIQIRLEPTEDVLRRVAAGKRNDQLIVAFAVDDGPQDQLDRKAREKLIAKGADYIVVNTLDAMDAEASQAAVLTAQQTVLPWARRSKEELARWIVDLIESAEPRLREESGRG